MPKLCIRVQALGGGVTAALLAAAFAIPAQAAAPTIALYGGGATFPERAYRDIMNCYGNSSGTDTENGLTTTTCNGLAGYRESTQVLYAGVGSGNGKKAFDNHNAAALTDGARVPDYPPVPSTGDFGPYYGPDTGAAWNATKSTINPFPKMSFAGSDDPFVASDISFYSGATSNGAAGNHVGTDFNTSFGPMKQVPAFVGAVTIAFNPASGTWTEKGKKPAGGGNSSLVSLSTNTWCGIYTGAITDWNNAEITADNGGVSITGGVSKPIDVVYRSDGSGTTFIFANAFIHQCDQSTHPLPAAWETSGGNSVGVSNNNWFLNLGPGHANILPANFHSAAGNGGIRNTVLANPGWVGYVSTDFAKPIDPTGPKAVNLQTWASFANNTTKVFKAASQKSASAIMSAFKAPSFAAATCAGLPEGCATDPLAWGKTNPTPTSLAAFPIGGFTFFELYTCYADPNEVDALAGIAPGSLGFFRWWYGSATDNAGKLKASLLANGFGTVPGPWNSAAKKLLFTNKPTKIAQAGVGTNKTNVSCWDKVGGA